MVDLFGLLMLLLGAVSFGPPDAWHWYVGAGVRYAYGEGGGRWSSSLRS